mgnify:CR=1 FL=1
MALALGQLTVHSAVRYFGRTPEGGKAWVTTTAGRVLFDGTPEQLTAQGPIDEVFRRITTGDRTAA